MSDTPKEEDPVARKARLTEQLKADAAGLRTKIAGLTGGTLKKAMERFVSPDERAKAEADEAKRDSGSRPSSGRRGMGKRRDSVDKFRFAGAAARGSAAGADPDPVEVTGIAADLDLSGMEIGAKGCGQLADLMWSRATHHLRNLDLSSDKLTDLGEDYEGVGALASALTKNTVLVALNLARNFLCKDGAAGVARMLRANKSIQFLDLSRNNLHSEGASIIARAIAHDSNPASALTAVNLSQNNLSNFEVDSEGGMALAMAVRQHRRLTFLDLSHNRLDSGAMSALAFAIKDNKVLVDLRLDDNGLNAEAAEMLASSLMHNRTLTRLSMSENVLLSDGAKEIAIALSANPVLSWVNLSHNHISKEGRTALGAVLRPDAESIIAALAESTSIVLPRQRHADVATPESARAAFAALAAAEAGGDAEGKAAADAGEGKGSEDAGAAAAAGGGGGGDGDDDGDEAAAAGAGAADAFETEDVDLLARKLVLTSPTSGQTVVLHEKM